MLCFREWSIFERDRFSNLRNEYTFTVNQIARRDDFPQLHTNFHFWADPAFFRIDPEKPEDLELLDTMKSVDTEDNHPFVFSHITKLILLRSLI